MSNSFSTYMHNVVNAAGLALGYLNPADGLVSNWPLCDFEDVQEAIDYAITDVWGLSAQGWDQKANDIWSVLGVIGEYASRDVYATREAETRRLMGVLNSDR